MRDVGEGGGDRGSQRAEVAAVLLFTVIIMQAEPAVTGSQILPQRPRSSGSKNSIIIINHTQMRGPRGQQVPVVSAAGGEQTQYLSGLKNPDPSQTASIERFLRPTV